MLAQGRRARWRGRAPVWTVVRRRWVGVAQSVVERGSEGRARGVVRRRWNSGGSWQRPAQGKEWFASIVTAIRTKDAKFSSVLYHAKRGQERRC